jgi:hypothetical protein
MSDVDPDKRVIIRELDKAISSGEKKKAWKNLQRGAETAREIHQQLKFYWLAE